jgi:hypothetical protein
MKLLKNMPDEIRQARETGGLRLKEGKLIATVPTNAEQDDIRGVAMPLKGGGMMLHEET